MKVRGARLVVRALEDEGVRFTFGIPGAHTIELYDALGESERTEPVLATGELGAAFMADGYARISGEVGVATVVPGPGVTQALSGVAEAMADHVAMVVITAAVGSNGGSGVPLHDIDARVLAPVTKAVVEVGRADQIYGELRRAFQLARQGVPGPVAVMIEADLLLLTAEVGEPAFTPVPEPAPALDQDLLEAAARMLGEAQRPVFIFGSGAASGAAAGQALAEQLGAPVVTTISGKGVFPEHHPLWLWNGVGAQAPKFVRTIFERSDCVLAVGCRFSANLGMVQPQRMIHVDLDPAVFHRAVPADLVVECDAAAFLDGLSTLIDGARPWHELAAEIASGHNKIAARARRGGDSRRVAPDRLFEALQEHCSLDAVFVVDSGNSAVTAVEHLRIDAPGRFIGPTDFASMGYAIPAAIGASLVGAERDVVAVTGDGALLMTGLEVLTGATYGAAPLVVVVRDGKLGQVAQLQGLPLNRETCSVLPDYILEDLCRAVGARYFRLIRDAELDAVLPAAIHLAREGSPAVVEVLIDDSRKTQFTRGMLRQNFWRLSWPERLRMVGRALRRRL